MATIGQTSPAIMYALKHKYAYATYELLSSGMVETFHGPRLKRVYNGKYYNCYGKLIWSSPFSKWGGETVQEGVAVDLRSLQLLRWGCCPDELSIDMIEGYE